jgi:hypothetical protein
MQSFNPSILQSSNRWLGGLFVALLGLGSISAANAQIISNSPTSGAWTPFGSPDTQTYGEVFTAPISGTLTSFTLSLNGGVGSLYGGVGTWSSISNGSPINLYQSANVSSSGAQSFTFSPDISVVSGQEYVAYLSVFGDAGANNQTTMPIGSSASGLDYFVWNNTTDERNNPTWNGGYAKSGSAADVVVSASFTPAAVPEPSTWAMMLGGLGLLAFWRTRTRRALL